MSAAPSNKRDIDIETEDYEPFEHRHVEHPTNDAETFMHLIKGFLGTGVLAMPYAFGNAGIWFGVIATIIVGSITGYCIQIFLKCSYILCKRHQVPSMSYADVAEQAVLNGPTSAQKYARIMRHAANASFVAGLLGICCVYVIFISRTIKQIVEHYTGTTIIVQYYMLAITIPLILICLIQNLKYLAPCATIANILIMISLIIIIYYIFRDPLPRLDSNPAIASPVYWPMFFGTILFAMEGIGVVMSLDNVMKNPNHLIGCPSILNIGMVTLILLYALIGFIGYWKYGAITCENISMNLPTKEYLAQAVKAMLAIALYFSYALQFYTPVPIMWMGIEDNVPVKWKFIGELAFRIFIVIITVGIAAILPNLGPFITVIGAICLVYLDILIPPLVELLTYREAPGYGRYKWILWKDILLFAFGVVGTTTGVYVSVLEFVVAFGKAVVDPTCAE